MKTLRRLVAVAVLLISYQMGMAQSNSIPTFKSDTEKQAWIDANPEAYAELNGTVKHVTVEEKNAYMKEHQVTVAKTDIKVSSEMKVAGKVSSVNQGDSALKEAKAAKEAAARKETEANKVKSTTQDK